MRGKSSNLWYQPTYFKKPFSLRRFSFGDTGIDVGLKESSISLLWVCQNLQKVGFVLKEIFSFSYCCSVVMNFSMLSHLIIQIAICFLKSCSSCSYSILLIKSMSINSSPSLNYFFFGDLDFLILNFEKEIYFLRIEEVW